MASPHVNGVVALMREVSPNIGVDEIKQIIYDTAYDLGDEGEDNDYGWGMIDAYEAVMNTNLPPDDPQKPSGETEGITTFEYSYSSSTTDPEGEQIFYMFSWGDNTTSEWLGPFDSGSTVNAAHAWDEEGTYNVKVKAKDVNDSVSGWSEPLSVIIIQAPLLDIQLIRGGLFKIKSSIKNLGSFEATEVNWEINLEGGNIFVGRTTTGKIPSILPQEEVEISSDLIFGFGNIRVVATAEIPGSTDTRDQGGRVFFIYINVNPSG
jgi:hypothetical protein